MHLHSLQKMFVFGLLWPADISPIQKQTFSHADPHSARCNLLYIKLLCIYVSNYLWWFRRHWHNHMKFKFCSGFPSLIFRNTSKCPIVINGSGRQKKFTFSVGSKTSFNVEIVPHVNIIDQSATIIDICFFILP